MSSLLKIVCLQANLKFNQSKDKDEKRKVDKAAVNYLNFLCEGRKVLLEDTAVLQDRYPKHRLFRLPCFQEPADGTEGTELQQKWKKYKDAVLAAHGRSVDDHLTVRRCLQALLCYRFCHNYSLRCSDPLSCLPETLSAHLCWTTAGALA